MTSRKPKTTKRALRPGDRVRLVLDGQSFGTFKIIPITRPFIRPDYYRLEGYKYEHAHRSDLVALPRTKPKRKPGVGR